MQILRQHIEKFIPLNENEWQMLLPFLEIRKIKKNEFLSEKGKVAHEIGFVMEGMLRHYYIKDGEEKTTAFYTEMEGFTPHCVINKAPSEYYISCVEDTILIVTNPEMEADSFNKFPKFESLCRILSEELLAKQQINFDEFKRNALKNKLYD